MSLQCHKFVKFSNNCEVESCSNISINLRRGNSDVENWSNFVNCQRCCDVNDWPQCSTNLRRPWDFAVTSKVDRKFLLIHNKRRRWDVESCSLQCQKLAETLTNSRRCGDVAVMSKLHLRRHEQIPTSFQVVATYLIKDLMFISCKNQYQTLEGMRRWHGGKP